MEIPVTEEEVRSKALGNIYAALSIDADRIGIFNEEVISNALNVLSGLGETCPTCPYLDSLEDEEPACECEEDFSEEEIVQSFVSCLDPSFIPEIGTYLIFCKN